MKFRTVLLALAIMAFASLSFADGFNVTIFTEVQLNTTCTGDEAIPNGAGTATVWWIGNGNDSPCEQGLGWHQYPTVSWPISDLDTGVPGTFYGDPGFGTSTTFEGTFQYIYKVVVDYPTVNPVVRWTSAPRTLVLGSNQDWIITEWTCETLVTECIPQNYDIYVQNWHTFAPYYQCLHLCPGVPTTVCLHGLKIDNVPHVALIPGCRLDPFCFDPQCPDAAPIATPWFFVPSPTGGPFGSWCVTLVSPLEGCLCLCVDFIESAELGNFDAVAGDNSVTVQWSTASSSDLSRFEIMRDGEFLTNVEAVNSATAQSYEYVDNTAVNGTTYTYSLVSVDMEGNRQAYDGTDSATPSMNAAVITEYALHQNYPNPFNPTTNIVFDVVNAGDVTLKVYNAMGQEVSTLVNGSREAGRHTVAFDAANLTSGLYFYTVKIGNEFTATKKMMLVK